MTWGREEPLEYIAFGGMQYDESSLKVEYPDGTRAIEWHVSSHRIERDRDTLTLTVELMDDEYPLIVELFYRVFDGEDVVERWARLANSGSEGTIAINQSYSADWWLPVGEFWRLRYLHGGWGRRDPDRRDDSRAGQVRTREPPGNDKPPAQPMVRSRPKWRGHRGSR